MCIFYVLSKKKKNIKSNHENLRSIEGKDTTPENKNTTPWPLLEGRRTKFGVEKFRRSKSCAGIDPTPRVLFLKDFVQGALVQCTLHKNVQIAKLNEQMNE